MVYVGSRVGWARCAYTRFGDRAVGVGELGGVYPSLDRWALSGYKRQWRRRSVFVEGFLVSGQGFGILGSLFSDDVGGLYPCLSCRLLAFWEAALSNSLVTHPS